MKCAILFRTHYWTSYLKDRLDEIRKMAPSADVYVAYDSTKSSPPQICGLAPHSLETLERLGLYIPKDNALWYCGDYPFYDFYVSYPGYDFYLMIENDVYMQGIDLDGIIRGALEQGKGILGAHFQLITDQKLGSVFTKGRDSYETWRKCFFPVVGLRRSALLALFSERIRQSEMKSKDPNFELPFCETYVGSQTCKLGLTHQELGRVAPLRTYGASRYMLYDKVISDPRPGIWHSVFPVDRYLDATIRQEYHRRGKDAFSDSQVIEALKDAIDYSGIPADQLCSRLNESTEGKVNKHIFRDKFESFVFPILRSNQPLMSGKSSDGSSIACFCQ